MTKRDEKAKQKTKSATRVPRRRNTRENLAADLRRELESHLAGLKLDALVAGNLTGDVRKALIRTSHSLQRADVLEREKVTLGKHVPRLLPYFADGAEIDPLQIRAELVPVESDQDSALLFRIATSLWSVPVSKGYGRRIRFLVMDRFNERLMGVIAIGDPVFNLRVRDDWIGWTVLRREQRLVNVMDAYVLGAVPPYSQLLGGKLVTALLGSREVGDYFQTMAIPLLRGRFFAESDRSPAPPVTIVNQTLVGDGHVCPRPFLSL